MGGQSGCVVPGLVSGDEIFGADVCDNGWDLQLPSVDISLRDHPPQSTVMRQDVSHREVILAPVTGNS